MKLNQSRATRVALLAASSLSVLALSSPAAAKGDDYRISDADRVNASDALRSMVANSTHWTPDLRIVTNDGPFITPAPGKDPIAVKYANSKDVLDTSGVNGVGQMISIELPFLSLCSGTLINPRTVITAAHCVYDNPAHMYGSDTGTGGGVPPGQGLPASTGIPISFGFEATNRCRGVQVNGCAIGDGPYEAWRDSGYESITSKHIYNGNQVWYHPDSNKEFGLADVALVTLDTHVQDIPTWTLLFSPLTGSTHVTITGYGAAGVGTTGIGDAAGIDYRRRVAENMIDALMSSGDWASSPAQGSYNGFNSEAHSLYWMDFDDPAYDPAHPTHPADTAWGNDPANPLPEALANPTAYNWNTNGIGGGALPKEGTTAGGDSGGPLIVDTKFDKPVVVGVLTGGWSFNGGIGTYGEFSVYPPLFLYWQDIVANNPYKYVSAKAGDADWFDATHWVQDMDPNYAVTNASGQLVNSLPNVAQVNPDSRAGRFGTNCFFETLCTDVNGTAYPTSTGGYIVTAGGPGSTNFVPNNVEPVNSSVPSRQVKARYYDVTLSQAGTTTLSKSATIDKLTIASSDTTRPTLNVTSTGNLNVWGDFNQLGGWTHVNGLLKTSEALVASGILSGSGVFDPTYLTVVGGAVGPQGANGALATLTVKGNVIMASASGLLIDMAGMNSSDQLKVLADANIGQLALNGGSLVLSQQQGGAVIRDRGSYVVATAQGGVSGKFGTVSLTSGGSLVPTVSYNGGQVKVTLKAGSLSTTAAGSSSTTLAFAGALDALRGTSYNNLWNLYGGVDLMSADRMEMTFGAMMPKIVGETQLLQDRQSRQLLGNVSDRLSLLGTGRAKGISFTGAAGALAQNRDGMSAPAQLGLASNGSADLPAAGGISGFVSVGGDNVRSSYGDTNQVDGGQRGRYFASGIESPMGDAMVGTAIGYAEATSTAGTDGAKSKVTQAVAYASLPVGKSAYVGGLVAAERASTDINRLTTDTVSMLRLSGGTHSSRYVANAEAGFRTGIGHGLSVNPRAQLGFSHYSLGGFREQGGETALELNGLNVNRIESRIGAKLDGTAMLGKWAVRPNLQADYVRLLSGANNGMSVSFAAAPDYDFILPLTNSGSGWMEVKGGVEVTRGAFTLGLSGQATAGDAPISDQRGAVDLTFKF